MQQIQNQWVGDYFNSGYAISLKLALLAVALSATASAGTVVLTFEGLQNNEEVLNYFDGGTGSDGSGPGTNYGITFGSDSLALIQDSAGGTGNFEGNPSGNASLYFLSGPGDIMNVPAGFTTGFSFYYSAINDPGTVTVWSGLNGTGTLLQTIDLPVTPTGYPTAPCTDASEDYCPFVPIGITFTGTAESVDFSGTANEIGFDEITLGSATAGGSVPEPRTVVLLGAGLAPLAVVRSRQMHQA
jgi:hypothetical protein